MIDPDTLCFPNNVVDFLGTALMGIDADTRVRKRPIKDTDESQSISVFPVDWNPVPNSMEMVGRRHEPTLQRYSIMVQGFIADMDEERGIRKHSLLSAQIRSTLYRSHAVAVALPQLVVSFSGSSGATTERVSKWGVVGQQYLNNQLPNNGKFLFLSTTEVFVETEFE
ncbi:hypothetical protein AXJ10_gp11 [Gordonia phage GordTnk2]|uniref:Uncharacterized protein n=2 Tax=Gordtnkvirus gordtnk2 TaxID=1982219 RepID=A0A0E3T6Q4_9CAUD|nr:hypothetical protein AXJ11_gp11 [Gordonia phage GordDuk1]YP_009223919.1 hypothetical protein AXJ10_gp11 [Gordonia phage GordTnk2]AKC02751.1 hypothetical protein GordTnk2_11 [Gordonia phage GordTnk2]AKC02939.1 hypothetical protein GordDuk1_11 [Gordonia phage GordDuk1]